MRRAGFLVVLLLAACHKSQDVGTQRAADIVAMVFSETAGTPVDVIRVAEDGSFYRVTFAGRQTKTPQDALVTRDGLRVTERVIVVEDEMRKLADDRRFVECLLANRVAVLGAPGTPATTDQLVMLGRFGWKLLIHCEMEPENCKRLGATSFPAILHDKTVHQGLHTREFMETLTGCK